ncbi:hypothetical protein SELMODRAFT_418238 [Selaginella moellendorffii]|uniref:Pentacotripeptide-repeat region of PRORP domain-containing protein n=1 Tax=Selaginella moellendorffii TaxID=88036 RepID=D8S539_SELML|nr:hypothetical protein SELMODRAFT_418238 [Selaginella moellendorffii]
MASLAAIGRRKGRICHTLSLDLGTCDLDRRGAMSSALAACLSMSQVETEPTGQKESAVESKRKRPARNASTDQKQTSFAKSASADQLRAPADRKRCHDLIKEAGRAGRLEDAEKLFNSISSPNAYSYNAMLQAYAVNNKPGEALELFQRATTRNAVSWNIVLNAHASFYGALPCFMRYPCWDSYSTTILRHFAIAELKAAVASSDLSLLEDVRAQYFKAFCYDDGYVDAIIRSTYTSLMHSLGTHGHLVDVAENVYKRIPSPDAAAFNALLAVYVKNGYYSRAQKLFAEGGGDRIDTRLGSSFRTGKGEGCLYLDKPCVSRCPEQQAKGSRFDDPEEGIEPTRVTFLVWVASGEELGTIVRDFDFVPDASHYGQVVVNLNRGGKFAATVELASCLSDDPVNWMAVLSAARMVGLRRDCSREASEAQERRWQVPHRIHHAAQHLLQHEAGKEAQRNPGKDQETQESESVPENYLKWMSQELDNEWKEVAIQTLARNKDVQIHEPNGDRIGSMVVDFGKYKGEKESLAKALKVLEEMPHDKTVVHWTMMLEVYSNTGDVDSARAMFDRMDEPDVASVNAICPKRPSSISTCGRYDDAKALFANTLNKDVYTWTSMIRACTMIRDETHAIQTFNEMILDGILPNRVTFIAILVASSQIFAMDPNNATPYIILVEIYGKSRTGEIAGLRKMVTEKGLEGDRGLEEAWSNQPCPTWWKNAHISCGGLIVNSFTVSKEAVVVAVMHVYFKFNRGLKLVAGARHEREVPVADKYFVKDNVTILSGILFSVSMLPCKFKVKHWCVFSGFLVGRRPHIELM